MNSSVIYKFDQEIDKINKMTDVPNNGSDQIFSDQRVFSVFSGAN